MFSFRIILDYTRWVSDFLNCRLPVAIPRVLVFKKKSTFFIKIKKLEICINLTETYFEVNFLIEIYKKNIKNIKTSGHCIDNNKSTKNENLYIYINTFNYIYASDTQR